MSDYPTYQNAIRYLLSKIDDDDKELRAQINTHQSKLNRLQREERLAGELSGDSRSLWVKTIYELNMIADDVTHKSLDDLEKLVRFPDTHDNEPQNSSRAFPFPGLAAMKEEDRKFFWGRDQEISCLLGQIDLDSLVIVNGLSGSGKSSLLKAGVIPRLRERGWGVIYKDVVKDIERDVLSAIRLFANRCDICNIDLSNSWFDALYQFHDVSGFPALLLVVDQFEQAMRATHNTESLKRFLADLSHLVNSERRFVKLILVVRADWLYYLDHSIKYTYPRLNVHSHIFTVDPLTPEAAREAVVKPLESRGIPYDEMVVTDIVTGLQIRHNILPVGEYVRPIQLQMVIHRLILHALKLGEPEKAFSLSIYESLGGVERILRDYLISAVGRGAENWRLLARFVDRIEKTGKTLRRSELLAVPAAQEIEQELMSLVSLGLVEAYEADQEGEAFFRLAHDFIADAILEYFQINPSQLDWQLAEEWLASGTYDLQNSLRVGRRGDVLLEESRYLHIFEYRDKLKVEKESRHLLVLSALKYGHGGIGYWLSRGEVTKDDLDTIESHLLSENLETVDNALRAISRASDSLGEFSGYWDNSHAQLLCSNLLKHFEGTKAPSAKTTAARALWALDRLETRGDRFRVGLVVLKWWLKQHVLQIASYFVTIITVALIFAGVLYIRETSQGDWSTVYSLVAGNVPFLAVDPGNSSTVYAITDGGPGPREGNTLYKYADGNWSLVSRDFSKSTATDFLIVRDESKLRIYVVLHSMGMLRSDDQGMTWDQINAGLPSRGLTDLVVHPANPKTLFLGTDDWRGVLVSYDAGDSWEFFDYGGEIYGSRITKLMFVKESVLFAGTADGRILSYDFKSKSWYLRFALPKGAISVLVSSPLEENTLYAGTDRGIVLRSIDGGGSWEVLGRIHNTVNIDQMVVDSDDPEGIFAVAYGVGGHTLWKSDDRGETWVQLSAAGLPRVRVQALISGEESGRLLAGTMAGVFSSSDKGVNWHQENFGAPLASVGRLARHPQIIAPVYASAHGMVFSNSDGLLGEWHAGKGLRVEMVRDVEVDPIDPKTAYASGFLLGEWPVFVTNDGGETWKQTPAPMIEPIVSDITVLKAVRGEDGQTLLLAGSLGCGLFQSEDGGNHWGTFGRSRCVSSNLSVPVDIEHIALSSGNIEHIFLASGRDFYTSRDGGWSWSYMNLGELGIDSPIIGLVADPVEPNTVYFITRSNGFFRSTDSGSTWNSIPNRCFLGSEPTSMISWSWKSESLVVGTANGGVWFSSDGGDGWHSIRGDLAVGTIVTIVGSDSTDGSLILGTLDDGIGVFTPGRTEFFGGH